MPASLTRIDTHILEIVVTGEVTSSELMNTLIPPMAQELQNQLLLSPNRLNILLVWQATKADFGKNIMLFAKEMRESNTYTHIAYGVVAIVGPSGLIKATARVMGAFTPFVFSFHRTYEEALMKLQSLPLQPHKSK
jgi:hypothetical protein